MKRSIYPLSDQVGRRGEVALGEEISEKDVGRRHCAQPEFMDLVQARPCNALLTRILELHRAGHTADEIAVQVLTTEPENAMFRAAMLVEIVLHSVGRCPEEKQP